MLFKYTNLFYDYHSKKAHYFSGGMNWNSTQIYIFLFQNKYTFSSYILFIDLENETYTSSGKIKTEYDLDKDITILRQSNPVIAKLNAKASQRIAKEIYGSYKLFFNLIKKDKTARPPHKIDDVSRFHTIVYNQSGWKFISNTEVKLNGITLKYKGIPSINGNYIPDYPKW